MIEIRAGGLGDARVEALIRHHRDEARSTTPAHNAHSLDSSGLSDPSVSFFAAWEGETLLGIGAIKQLDAAHAELKSMRTAPDHLRRGVARAMLAHLIAVARARG
ncbi:GNAT family N-acetyltransferase [Hephaestia mangrovi]|uniref:GNAT family N-acetyltransferase n=1 Tax=Hephaestia mangrovi TaxID=2873268 RepID=UPI0034E1FB29